MGQEEKTDRVLFVWDLSKLTYQLAYLLLGWNLRVAIDGIVFHHALEMPIVIPGQVHDVDLFTLILCLEHAETE